MWTTYFRCYAESYYTCVIVLPCICCIFSGVNSLSALALVVYLMDACTFIFWLIGVESPGLEKKRKHLLRDLNLGCIGLPITIQSIVPENKHPLSAGIVVGSDRQHMGTHHTIPYSMAPHNGCAWASDVKHSKDLAIAKSA
jgi:hypothetical protein